MRARLADPHARAGIDGAPDLEVERELEPFALGERRVGYPDAQRATVQLLDAAARPFQEGDEVAGAPRVVEVDLHGPLGGLHRAARWGRSHRGGRALWAKLPVGADRPPRTNGKGRVGAQTGGPLLAGASVAALAVGSLAVQVRLGAVDRIGPFLCVALVLLLVLYAAALGHRRAVAAAVASERRRMARELHDGLAQELAFVVTECSRLGLDPGLHGIAETAQRALAESRRAILALRRPVAASLAEELEQVAHHAADRAGLRLDLRLARGVDLAPAARSELSRVVNESIANAARHAGATSVCVELSAGHGTRLAVSDDGVGFDPSRSEAVRPGFGILGMRERVTALGGELRIVSRPQRGTRVEVLLP